MRMSYFPPLHLHCRSLQVLQRFPLCYFLEVVFSDRCATSQLLLSTSRHPFSVIPFLSSHIFRPIFERELANVKLKVAILCRRPGSIPMHMSSDSRIKMYNSSHLYRNSIPSRPVGYLLQTFPREREREKLARFRRPGERSHLRKPPASPSPRYPSSFRAELIFGLVIQTTFPQLGHFRHLVNPLISDRRLSAAS